MNPTWSNLEPSGVGSCNGFVTSFQCPTGIALSNFAHCRLVNELHFPLPPPPGGIVGVDCLLETLFGRDGGDHGMRIGGRKSEARGGVMGRGDINLTYTLKGAYFSSHVCVKPFRDV